MLMKHKKFYKFFSIIFAFLGLVQIVRWNGDSAISIYALLIGILPSTSFIGAYFLSKKIHKPIIHFFLIALCILSVLIFGFVSLLLESFSQMTDEVIEVSRYEKILSENWNTNSNLVEHFPKDIPADAQNVKFSFFPGFMQGGAYIQLRYSINNNQIDALSNQFASRKIASFYGGNVNDHLSSDENIHTTYFYTNDSNNYTFPTDYEIVVLKAESCDPEKCGFKWNHGESSGVAISKQRSEIVFWAESW